MTIDVYKRLNIIKTQNNNNKRDLKTYIVETNIMVNDRIGELKIMVKKECRAVLFNCVNLNLITNSKQ